MIIITCDDDYSLMMMIIIKNDIEHSTCSYDYHQTFKIKVLFTILWLLS